MIKVKLLGKLGKQFIREMLLDIHCTSEAIRALMANFPNFANFLNNSESNGIGYKIYSCPDVWLNIGEKDLSQPISKTLIIAPVVTGSGGLGKIIAGTVLLGSALLFPGAIGALGFEILSPTTVGLIGAALILGGISQLLTPKVKKSYLIDGQANTTGQGNPVPLVYGRLIIGSQVISAGITTWNY